MKMSAVTAEDVRRAIAECDNVGPIKFRRDNGFGEARIYDLVYEGHRYDSKAILGVAYFYATGERPRHYSGGAATVVRRLRQLGFTVEERHVNEPLPAPRQRLVLIAPCYGNAASRSRFADTLAHEVAFTDEPWSSCLSPGELEKLLRVHPGGKARFWGALASHDGRIDRLAQGDPILFTGLNRVQALGRVGCKLRNKALADALWKPDPDTGSWSNVYSMLDFQLVRDLRYSDIQVLAGYEPGDRFQSTRVPSAEISAALIAGLGLDRDDYEKQDQQAEEALARALAAASSLVDAEASHVDTTEYERQSGTVTLRRAEARLVALYVRTLSDPQAKRLRLAVGWTDLYVVADGDLIEAKRSSEHRFVRQALGQLLDYAAHSDQPINRLTALLPAGPADIDVQLLHSYGIDCLHWAGGTDFCRLPAPPEAVERIRPAWSCLAQKPVQA
jgi:hypothetical protein